MCYILLYGQCLAVRHIKRGKAVQHLEKLISRRELHVIREDASVSEAVKKLDGHNIGALPVVRGERVVGIFSERDVVRRVVLPELDPSSTNVGDVMTKDIVVGDLADGFEKCQDMIRAAGVRHLPIVHEKKLVGFVSLRDFFRQEIRIQAEEIRHLTDYIHFVPPTAEPTEA